MTVIQIVAIVLIVLLNVNEAFTDNAIQKLGLNSILIDKKKYISRWHNLDAIDKAVYQSLLALYLGGLTLDTLWFVGIFIMLRWTVFEWTLNKLNGNKFYFIGTTSFIDRMIWKVPFGFSITNGVFKWNRDKLEIGLVPIKLVIITMLILIKTQ